jgi:adenosylmethionine---8-amino-7-oxononanoate aminotransferase
MTLNQTTLDNIAGLDRNYIWHPFTRMREWMGHGPLVIESGLGCILKDVDGKEYIDAISSLWVNVHGHNKPEINQAIADQLQCIAHSTLLGSASVPSAMLAQRLIDIAPDRLTRVFFSDNGSTGVEVALKQAYQFWRNKNGKKNKRVNFARMQYAYHGDTVGAVSVGGIDLFHETFGRLLFETIEIPSPYCYRCPMKRDGGGCKWECIEAARKIISKHKDSLAALIMEPLVQGAAGFIMHPEGYLSSIASICRDHGILLVLDEVAVGFGRTGTMFACEQENVQPDFLVLSKGLTGGYMAMAVTLSTEEIFSAFLDDDGGEKTFYHGHSYTGNQLACAASLASLEIFKTENVLTAIQPRILQLKNAAEEIADLPLVGDARHKGLMAAFELVADKETKGPFPKSLYIGEKICQEMVKRGILMRPLGDVVYIIPPLSITEQELETVTTQLYNVIKNFEVA